MLRFTGLWPLVILVSAVGCNREKTLPEKPDVSRPPISFRWVETESAPELIQAVVVGSNERVYVHRVSILEGEDLASIIAMPSDDGYPSLAMKFTPSGQEKLARVSTLNSGRRLGLIVDGVVVCAVTCRGPIGEDAIITGAFSMAEAERLAKRMNEFCPGR